MIKDTLCAHMGALQRSALQKIPLFRLLTQCPDHGSAPTIVCLHCAAALCSPTIQAECLKSHIAQHNNHYFFMHIRQFIVECAACNAVIQQMAFDFGGDHRSDGYLRISRFIDYLKELWLNLSEIQGSKEAIAHRGIRNLGNTCFLNSVLQALFACPPLRNLYKKLAIETKKMRFGKKIVPKEVEYFYDEVIEEGKSQSWNLVRPKRERQKLEERRVTSEVKDCSLNALFKEILGELEEQGEPLKPVSLLQSLASLRKKYGQKSEQDAEELLGFLLDALSQGEKIGLQPDQERYKAVEALLGPQKLTPLQQTFGFYLLNETRCTQCLQSSFVFDLSYSIALPLNYCPSEEKWEGNGQAIPAKHWQHLHYPNTDPPPLLSHFFAPERLTQQDNYFCCGKCKSLVAVRRYFLVDPPPVLIISLKRFNPKLEKRREWVEFPEELSIEGVCASEPQIKKYRLGAVVVHEGRQLSSGHYISYIKLQQCQWLRCSDDRVNHVKWSQVRIQQAYILFYLRLE